MEMDSAIVDSSADVLGVQGLLDLIPRPRQAVRVDLYDEQMMSVPIAILNWSREQER